MADREWAIARRDTLVVETTHYLNGFQGSTPDVKITERYTRVRADFIN